MTHKEVNLEILRLLSLEINQHPDLRFGQILRNLEVVASVFDPHTAKSTWVNGFYEESDVVLRRMRAVLSTKNHKEID